MNLIGDLYSQTCSTVEYKQNKKHNTHKHKQTCTYTVHTYTHTHMHTHTHTWKCIDTSVQTNIIATHAHAYSIGHLIGQHTPSALALQAYSIGHLIGYRTTYSICFSTARVQHWTSHWTSHTISFLFSTGRMIQQCTGSTQKTMRAARPAGQPATDKECSLCVEYLTVSTKVWQLNSQCVSNDWVRDELEIIISDNSPFISLKQEESASCCVPFCSLLNCCKASCFSYRQSIDRSIVHTGRPRPHIVNVQRDATAVN